jgi:hypothetical protein
MIAMAILVLALAALSGHEGIAIQMSDYSNRLSQATLLAEGKLLDVEHRLTKDTSYMSELDDCEQGDFGDVGFDNFQWKACAYKLEVPEGSTDQIAERFMSTITGLDPSMLGGGGGNLAAAAGAADPSGQIGNNIAMAMGAIPIFLQQLEDKIRKVRLEVSWKDVVGERSVVLERFVTTLGQDRRGIPAPPSDDDGAGGAKGGG